MNTRIPVGDFRIGDVEKKAIMAVLDLGRISEGKCVREFEKNFAKFIGTKYAIALNSGTSALIAGLTALTYYKELGIKPGTKVITSPVTYIATVNAIVLAGFKPVFVDIDKHTFGITPEGIEAHLKSVKDPENYSLILPVHLMGYVCDMDGINRVAKKYNLKTFEDSAQAHGSTYRGRRAGSLSLLSDFSFYIAHNIQAGEMGAITTDDSEIIRLVRKIKSNGRMCDCPVCTRSEGRCPRLSSYKGDDDFDPRFTHDYIGYNFKAMEFQAALGVTQLKKANWIMERRIENVEYLNQGLRQFSKVLQLPRFSRNVSYLAYPLVIKKPEIISRKELRRELEKRNIETRPLFGSIPTQQPAYSRYKNKYKGKLPNADYVGENGFYIGCHQYLNKENLKFIVKAFEAIFGGTT